MSIATGTLLIVATAAVLGGSALDPTLTGPGYLTEVANHPTGSPRPRFSIWSQLVLVPASRSRSSPF
jgi:hypothetical protein